MFDICRFIPLETTLCFYTAVQDHGGIQCIETSDVYAGKIKHIFDDICHYIFNSHIVSFINQNTLYDHELTALIFVYLSQSEAGWAGVRIFCSRRGDIIN